MIIDNTKEEYAKFDNNVNGEVLLDANPVSGGFIHCSQETAYLFAVATDEQQIRGGHSNYDYTSLDKGICNKPDVATVANQYAGASQELLNSLDVPEPAKAGFQNRINGLLTAMNAVSFDDGLRLALQLPIDIGST